ncbi:tetraspanin-11-like [Symsagittifera roscoffensis]|uniref:tetraspanin-11-like n=1 Tax=Symsagittifera roscoffensis TaxID=84072 RepID=UPI00307C3D36
MDPFYSDGSQGVSLMHSSSSPRKSEKKKKCCCDCESRSIQTYIMIIANAFFLLAGILLIVVGCLSLAHRDYYGNFLSGATYGFVTWTLVFVGVFVVIVSLFGLYAAFKEGKLLLKIYAVLVGVVIAIELSVVIVALVYRGKTYRKLESHFNSTIVNQYGSNGDVTKALDQLHQDHQCCGVNSFMDWQYSSWVQNQNRGKSADDGDEMFVHVPDSCCKTVLDNCGTMSHPNNLHNQGCFKQVADFFARNLLVLSLCAICVILLQVMALVSALVLLKRVRKQVVWQWY